ncbi:hypothetical protein D9757_000893 [Collybiopsis confluens]|uniref:Methyltransferase domain-containing protein n=1 Tax=Collybiopsis confluens TaxID=2823264 RepID=A0A8H5I0K8_9AGAR|nr:hypothetical protein D9757_000893 [Collybiopsis confluens]
MADDLVHLLLETHPNAAAKNILQFEAKIGLAQNWDWQHILDSYISHSTIGLPPAICALIEHVHRHSLPRDPFSIPASNKPPRLTGMSPKKAYEVFRMATYVAFVAQNLPYDSGVYIVDIGAGQGHLARAMSSTVPDIRGILALDGDEIIVKKSNLQSETPKVTHRLGYITSPAGIIDAVDEWISEIHAGPERVPVIIVSLHGCGSLSIDVLRAFVQGCRNDEGRNWSFVASVTVPCCYNLLRESDSFPLPPSKKHDETSPPPSPPPPQTSILPIPLPPNAYHLAAQVPNMWVIPNLNSNTSISVAPPASLAVRKVVWRALLEFCLLDSRRQSEDSSSSSSIAPTLRPRPKFIPPMEANTYFVNQANHSTRTADLSKSSNPSHPNAHPSRDVDLDLDPDSDQRTGHLASSDSLPGNIARLGRLPSRAYESWNMYLEVAGGRAGVDLSRFGEREKGVGEGEKEEEEEDNAYYRKKVERVLGILHVLRCILGPLIESQLLMDRVEWMRGELEEEMGRERGYAVELVPLFSQVGDGTGGGGSARNMAVVILPKCK